MKISVDIDTEKILKSRGLGADQSAALFLASEVRRFSDPYVPMQTRNLKDNYSITSNGKTTVLTYKGPYAHYQYRGEVMGGRAPKHYTGEPINYHDAEGEGLRGKEWDKRMMADRGDDVVRSLAKFVGGEPD